MKNKTVEVVIETVNIKIVQISFYHYFNGFWFQRSLVIIVWYFTLFSYFQIVTLHYIQDPEEGYIFPSVKLALLLLSYIFTYCWLDPTFIRIRSFFFSVSWSLLKKLNIKRGRILSLSVSNRTKWLQKYVSMYECPNISWSEMTRFIHLSRILHK